MLEMFMDYSFVLKGKAKETQDTDGEAAEDTSQQTSIESFSLLGQLTSTSPCGVDGASATTTALSSALKHNVTIRSPSGCG